MCRRIWELSRSQPWLHLAQLGKLQSRTPFLLFQVEIYAVNFYSLALRGRAHDFRSDILADIPKPRIALGILPAEQKAGRIGRPRRRVQQQPPPPGLCAVINRCRPDDIGLSAI